MCGGSPSVPQVAQEPPKITPPQQMPDNQLSGMTAATDARRAAVRANTPMIVTDPMGLLSMLTTTRSNKSMLG